MNTESHYIYDQSNEAQGLGRMPSRATMLRPVLDEQVPRNRIRQIKPRIRPRPIPRPKPARIPRPVIDKNPVPAPPKLNINNVKKTSTQKSQPTSKPKPTNKPVSNQPNSSNDILAGTFSIGGVQVAKTHAAMATGGIAGGLLLWKILF